MKLQKRMNRYAKFMWAIIIATILFLIGALALILVSEFATVPYDWIGYYLIGGALICTFAAIVALGVICTVEKEKLTKLIDQTVNEKTESLAKDNILEINNDIYMCLTLKDDVVYFKRPILNQETGAVIPVDGSQGKVFEEMSFDDILSAEDSYKYSSITWTLSETRVSFSKAPGYWLQIEVIGADGQTEVACEANYSQAIDDMLAAKGVQIIGKEFLSMPAVIQPKPVLIKKFVHNNAVSINRVLVCVVILCASIALGILLKNTTVATMLGVMGILYTLKGSISSVPTKLMFYDEYVQDNRFIFHRNEIIKVIKSIHNGKEYFVLSTTNSSIVIPIKKGLEEYLRSYFANEVFEIR